MITAVSKNELNRIKEKRSEEISPRYLENFENGYYEEGEENEESKVVICSKGRISAAQAKQSDKAQAILVSGKYRIVTVPIGNASLQDPSPKRLSVYAGPTGEQVFWIAYPENEFEKAMPAAFPASLWLNEALEFERNGRRDRALDIIFSEMDKLFRKGDFDVCNRLLELLDVDHLSPNLLIAFLTITLSAHEWLPARTDFYSRIENRLAHQPNKAKLLSGLKGPALHGPRFY
jgi:hypothetical protein